LAFSVTYKINNVLC